MRSFTKVGLAVCLAAGSFACTAEVDDSEPGYYAGGGPYAGSSDYSGFEDGGILGDGAPSTTPMLAKIDPNAVMTQSPGQGVGVFAQYDSTTTSDPGGHWYIWWTCDTTLSQLPCDFRVTVTTAQGDITNVSSQGFKNSDRLSGGGPTVGSGTGTGSTSTATATESATATATGTDGATGTGTSTATSTSIAVSTSSSSAAGATSIVADTTTTTTVQGIHFDTVPGAVVTLSAALGGEYSGSFLFFVQDNKVNGGYTGELTDPLELQPSSP